MEFDSLMIFIMGIILIIALFMMNRSDNNITIGNEHTESYADIISILDSTIKREFGFKYKLEYELKGQKIIYNFEDDYKNLSKDVLSALSLDFIKKFEKYHSREYLLFYITRNVQIMLIEYIDAKK